MNITENFPKYALSGRMEIHLYVFWGRCPALTPSRASGTADHVRSLDDLLYKGNLIGMISTQMSNEMA